MYKEHNVTKHIALISRRQQPTYLGLYMSTLVYHTYTKLSNFPRFRRHPKLYIPSTLNIDLILWHTQLIVCALKC